MSEQKCVPVAVLIELRETQEMLLAAERLGGNVVKEAHAKGALTMLNAIDQAAATQPAQAEGEARIEELEARIDALMLEHCPDEMSAEQVQRFADSQRSVVDGPSYRSAAPNVGQPATCEEIVRAIPAHKFTDMAVEDAAWLLYLQGGCTESECKLCRTSQFARTRDMHHAGIPSYPRPNAAGQR